MDNNEYKNITDYENPNQYSSKKTIKRYRIALVIISVIAIGLIAVFGMHAYEVSKIDPFEQPGSTLAQDYFLASAKTYFEFDPTKLPSSNGSCTTVALQTIQEQKLISDINYYKKCDKDVSMVKVCKLESGNYHFEVSMQCENNTSTVAYGEEKPLVNEQDILGKMNAKVNFSYQAEKLNTDKTTVGEKETMWLDEVPYTNYKIVKQTTYYRYRDKNWAYQGDVRFYYPQDKSNTELVTEYYKESPNELYPFKEVSQNFAYKWYIQNDDGPKYYYPSGTTNRDEEITYYLTAPVQGAKRDEETKTYASKYYRVEKMERSDLLPSKPSPNAKRIDDSEVWSAWSEYTRVVPDTKPFKDGTREIETRIKVEIVPLTNLNGEIEWDRLSEEYLSEEELISLLQSRGYDVHTIEEVAALPDVKYNIKQTYREPKEA